MENQQNKSEWQIERNDNGEVYRYTLNNFAKSLVGKFILWRIQKDRDVKILITGSGSATGVGKSTLAIQIRDWLEPLMAEYFQRELVMDPEHYAFMDGWEYMQHYDTAQKGEVLIMDEIEEVLDNRRSLTSRNVEFTQMWQKYRYKNVVTIGTAPSIHVLDKRARKNTDIWINCTRQGHANVYYLSEDDFTGEIIFQRLRRHNMKESIKWNAMDGHPAKTYLDGLKTENLNENSQGESEQELTKSDMNTAIRNAKTETCINLLEQFEDTPGISQGDIADLIPDGEGGSMSQQWVSRVGNDHYPDGENPWSR